MVAPTELPTVLVRSCTKREKTSLPRYQDETLGILGTQSTSPQFLHCLSPILALFLQQGSTHLGAHLLIGPQVQGEVPFVSPNKSRKPLASMICSGRKQFDVTGGQGICFELKAI